MKSNILLASSLTKKAGELRILTRKKDPKIRLQLLRRIQLWTFVSLEHQINSSIK